jgi:class 3 adenylate cyclase
LGTPESRSALFEQAVANLLAIAPVQLLSTRPDDRFDFLFRRGPARVAVEVKAASPAQPALQRVIGNAARTRTRANQFWLVTPRAPSLSSRSQFETRVKGLHITVFWFGAKEFQQHIGLPPRRLESDEDLASLQFAAAARRLSPQKAQQPAIQQYLGRLSDDSGSSALGLLQISERVASSGPQSISDESVSEFLRLGKRTAGVTALVSDLKNYSTLVRVARADDLIEVMNRYFRRARQIVLDAGGYFHQLTGDGVVALFGYPHRDPCAAARAVRAAADLAVLGNETLTELSGRMNEAVEIGTRLGAATDDLWALNASDHSFDPVFVGNAINLAARLQAEAPTDGLLMDNKTHRALGAADCPEPVTVKARQRVLGPNQTRGQLVDINVWDVGSEDLRSLATVDRGGSGNPNGLS